MAQPPPLWRQLYDRVEHTVAPPLDSLVRSEHFARAVALAEWARGAARERAGELSARVWHLVNLPAGTDVAALRARIGALDREVRRLSLRLEGVSHQKEAATDDLVDELGTPDARPSSPGGPGAPRGGAQRPAGP